LRSTRTNPFAVLGHLIAVVVLIAPSPAKAQGIDLTDRPVAAIRIEGLAEIPEQLVLNQIRLIKGTPYASGTVRDDIVRITHLGRFSNVQAQVEPQQDGSLIVTYVLTEESPVSDIQIAGNKNISDQELLALVRLRPGDPGYKHLIEHGVKQIQRAYKKAGYFSTSVVYDQKTLSESGVLIYRIREGPIVRIRRIIFQGHAAFIKKELRSKIRSNTYAFILRPGTLNREELDADTARLRDFYHQRGYLDAQVGRRIDLSPDNKDAVVTFLIDEGRRYTVGNIRIEGNAVFSRAQIVEAMPLKSGDIFLARKLRNSHAAIVNLYGTLGYIETRVQIDRLFYDKQPKVDLVVSIREGQSYLVGTISVRGNQLTQDKVIYRTIRGMSQGRRFDYAGMRKTETLLKQSSLFSDAKITLLGNPKDPYRDVLIEVKEANSGSLSFGAGISSDAGLLGAIELTQRNFDITDLPESAGEFFTGKAFRGAGQFFSLNLQPGNQVSRYSVSFREPYVLDSDYSLDTNLFYFDREREDWDEKRTGGILGSGHRFGDVWSASVRLRVEEIDITNIDPSAPTDVFNVQDSSQITSLGFVMSRNNTDSRIFPTRGNRVRVEVTRVGALGGDYDFTKIKTEFKQFWTVEEDFFGRRTVVSLRLEIGHIIENNEAPIFERFYAGGHRSFRGFRFRGAGPRGVRNDTKALGNDPVGGDWLFLLGLEYNFPIYKEVMRGVVFLDTGTVQDDFGLDEYRASFGVGLRLKVPFLGQAPFALDFAVPILKEDGDETQAISFDLALPF